MVRKLPPALAVAMVWLATVAGVSATAWVAIDRAGRDVTGGAVSPLLPASVGTAVAGPTPSGGPSPTGRTTQPPKSATAATPTSSTTPRDRTVNVAGGQVSVRCTGAAILLRIAQPDNGWRVEVRSSGPAKVNLVFRSGTDDVGTERALTAVCTRGTPTFSVAHDS